MHLDRREFFRRGSALAGAAVLPFDAPRPARVRPRAGLVRLASNENPYGPSPRARAAMVEHWEEASRYGASALNELRDAIAVAEKVPQDHVLVTQGSIEGLCATAAAFCKDGGGFVHAAPTYESMHGYAARLGATLVPVPLDAELAHDLPAMAARVGEGTRIVFVCNPNNPSGTIVDGAALSSFCESVGGKALVFVDEAYRDFVDDPVHRSMVPLVLAGRNVVVARTASKIHGMAGLRIGWLIAKPDLLARIRDFKMGFPNAMAARAVIASLDDREYSAYCKQQNTRARRILVDALDELGLRHAPSHTNFVFFRSKRDATELRAAFEPLGFAIGRAFPPLTDWCRVSLGTPGEMDDFVAALRKIFA